MSELINNTDPQAIENLSGKIVDYAKNLLREMQSLVDTHDNMQYYWSGDQYDKMSNSIVEMKTDVGSQARELLRIAENMHNQAVSLANATGVALQRRWHD